MNKRTPEQFFLPGFSQWRPADSSPAAEVLARYEAERRCDVGALVSEAREYELSLDQLLALVRAAWHAQSET